MKGQNILVHFNGYRSHQCGDKTMAGIVTAVSGNIVSATIFPPGHAPEYVSALLPGPANPKTAFMTYELVKTEAPAAKEPKAPKPPADPAKAK